MRKTVNGISTVKLLVAAYVLMFMAAGVVAHTPTEADQQVELAVRISPTPTPENTPGREFAFSTDDLPIVQTTTVPPVEQFDLPLLSPNVIASAGQIYRSGLAQGNNPNSFILMGDSNTELPKFLQSFGTNNYDLDGYAYLQSVVDAYAQSGSFTASYPSSEHGMTVNMLMDPLFVNHSICPGAAHPLDCAIRLYKPSVAIIYMGTYDTCFTPYNQYVENFDHAMQFLIERGVIPILTMYTVVLKEGCWENTPAYMQTITDMAATYQVPFIDLHTAVQPLPRWGMLDDGWHLSWPEDYYSSFAGNQYLYGSTMRELLTLQMLYLLRRDVMGMP